MNIPNDLLYTRDHEWLRVSGGEGSMGITDYAQGELGDIVFLDLPDVGTKVSQGKSFGSIEAVKAAADLNAPVSGEILAVNPALEHAPETINQSPYGDGWIVKIKLSTPADTANLLDPRSYAAWVEQSHGESH